MARWTPEDYRRVTEKVSEKPPSPRGKLEALWEGGSSMETIFGDRQDFKKIKQELEKRGQPLHGFEFLLAPYASGALSGGPLGNLADFILKEAEKCGFNPKCKREIRKKYFYNYEPYDSLKEFFISCAKEKKKE